MKACSIVYVLSMTIPSKQIYAITKPHKRHTHTLQRHEGESLREQQKIFCRPLPQAAML